jgi:hypothetical protein
MIYSVLRRLRNPVRDCAAELPVHGTIGCEELIGFPAKTRLESDMPELLRWTEAQEAVDSVNEERNSLIARGLAR